MVSPVRPEVADSAATPRRDRTRQRPAGPSTRTRSDGPCVLSRGHSLGDCQSYGPHSSTTMALRSRRAFAATGHRSGAFSMVGMRHHVVVGTIRVGSHACDAVSSTTLRTLSMSLLFAIRVRSFTRVKRLSTTRHARLRVSRYLG